LSRFAKHTWQIGFFFLPYPFQPAASINHNLFLKASRLERDRTVKDYLDLLDEGTGLLLVGGQAVNLWAERYRENEPARQSETSRSISSSRRTLRAQNWRTHHAITYPPHADRGQSAPPRRQIPSSVLHHPNTSSIARSFISVSRVSFSASDPSTMPAPA